MLHLFLKEKSRLIVALNDSMFGFVFYQPDGLWNICHFGTVFFRFFLDNLIRGERPAVCRRVLTCICLKGFIKLIIIHTHIQIFEKQKKNTYVF